jgi:hypothetical protein
MFGRKVVFYEASHETHQGIYHGGNTLYINVDGNVSALAVAGHEFIHSLKKSHPELYAKAHAATVAMLKADIKRAAGYRRYYGKNKGSERLNMDALADELLSDIGGNAMQDGSFFKEMFDQIHATHPHTEARSLITKIRDAFVAFLDKLTKATPLKGFQHGYTREEVANVRKMVIDMAAASFITNERQRMGLDAAPVGTTGGAAQFSTAKRGEPMQGIKEGQKAEQSNPLTEKQWQDTREIGLAKLSEEDRDRAIAAEDKYLAAQERANRDSEKFKEVAKSALAGMATPQLSSVPLMTGASNPTIKGTGKNNKTRVIDVARVLRKRILARAADITTAEGRERIAKAIVHEALYSMSLDGHAIGWYDRKVREALAVSAVANPEILTDKNSNFSFRLIAAITSNGQAVRDNFILANDIYQIWRSEGKFPTDFNGGGTRAPAMKVAFQNLNEMVEKHGWEVTERELMTMRTVREIESAFGQKVSGELKDALVPTAVGMGGPKIGNFFANLSGYFDSPTMDLWFMRTVGRMTGGIIATKPGLVGHLDTLLDILPQTGSVHGVKVAKIRDEIAQYKELSEAERLDPEVTIRVLKNTEAYGRAQYAKFSAMDAAGKTFTDKSPANENARSLKFNLSALVEAPGSGTQRANLRETVVRALQLLDRQGIKLTAADLQAVLWYYEKNLYGKLGDISESAKPWDYASAARFGVGRQLGLVDVGSSDRAGQVRGGESGVFEEESAGVDEGDGIADEEISRERVKQSTARGVNIEVAPDPRDVAAKEGFEKLSEKNKKAVTYAVAQKMLPKLLADMGIKGRIEYTIGGFAGGTTPSIIVHFEDSVPYADVREFAIASGAMLRQQAAISYDENDTTSSGQTTFVYVEPSRALSYDEQQQLFKEINAAYPAAGGFTGRDGLLVFGNFDSLDDAEFHNGIDKALQSAIEGLEYDANTRAKRFLSDWHEPLDIGATRYGQSNETAARRTDDNGRQGFYNSLQSESDRLVKSEIAKFSTARSDGASSPLAGAGLAGTSQGSKPGSVKAEGVHYSKKERQALSSSMFGTGLQGAELQRVKDATDPRIKQRIYFYINTGKGINPEGGVGIQAHTAQLDNLYDATNDTFDLAIGRDGNEFESAVLDHGFDGYLHQGYGIAVLLGQRVISVKPIGTVSNPEVAQAGVAEKSAFGKAQQSVMDNRSLPGGEMTGADWKRMMPKLMPGVDVSHLNDDQKYYRDQLVQRPKLSPVRALQSLAEEKENFRLGTSSSPEIGKIIDDMWSGESVQIGARETTSNGKPQIYVGALVGKGASKVVRRDMTMYDTDTNLPYVEIFPERAMISGAGLYQVAMAWAHNNGGKLAPDATLLPINYLRRSEAMISSMLRFKTSEHLLPHWTQYIGLLSKEEYDAHIKGNANSNLPDVLQVQIDEGIKAKLKTLLKDNWLDNASTKEQHDRNLDKLYESASNLATWREPRIADYAVGKDGELYGKQGRVVQDIADVIKDESGRSGVGSTTLYRAALYRTVAEASGEVANSDDLRTLDTKSGVAVPPRTRDILPAGQHWPAASEAVQPSLAGALPAAIGTRRPLYSAARETGSVDQNAVPNDPAFNRVLDADTLTALRRAAANLERPEAGVFLRVTEDGNAIATGPKGARIPDAFRRFANDNDLAFFAERRIPRAPNLAMGEGNNAANAPRGITHKSEPMPIAYRESGARYFGEDVGEAFDRTDRTRFSTQRLAPNGKPSNLNERQWNQVRTPEFKAWFGDWEKHASAENPVGSLWSDDTVSKVVDENGEPLVVYHGAKRGGFTVMRPDKGDKHRSPMTFAAATVGTARSYSGRGDEISFALDQELLNALADEYHGALFSELSKVDQQEIERELYDEREQSGIYSLFLNIKNPNESHFEGANWDGQPAPDTFELWDTINDEQIYNENGKATMTYDEALSLVLSLQTKEDLLSGVGRYDVRQASQRFETTNSVGEDAKKYGNDGAIIRQVVDDGGQSGGAYDPDDVFIFFNSNQAKSATQNTGAYSKSDDDIRFSTPRFVSQLATQIDKAPVKQLNTGKQWAAWVIGGKLQQLGVKKEEVEWSGLLDYLKMSADQKVSLADIQAFLSENGTQVVKKLNRDALPISVRGSPSSVQYKATGDDSG